MGKNFDIQKKGKVGEIRYPAYNGTNGFWQRPRWDLITNVDEEDNINKCKYIWNYATVRAIELIKEHKDILLEEEEVI